MRQILALVMLSLTAAPLSAQEHPQGLPIRKIVLYKHGVGYFEREGPITGDAAVTLGFKANQMKDVLKSLYAVDLGGGTIGTVVYDSKDPISKQLEDILFRVPEGRAMSEFLQQLKGARVRVALGTQATEGTILGLEPVQTRTEQGGTITRYKLVLLLKEGEIQHLDLLEASSIVILDEHLRKDLERMMEIYARSRHADRKSVEIRGRGEGKRPIRVGYIIETPIWKTSYRLLLNGEEPPLLQGWAIVENSTDEDWQDVTLSFIAGSPMSFIMDLYTSYYPRRPVIDMQVAAAAPPEAPAAKPPAALRRSALAARSAESEMQERGRADKKTEAGDFLADLFEQSITDETISQEVGELFSYTARSAVSIRQGQAALVPIIQERLERGGRVLHFRADSSRHPSHAYDMRNTTALTLEKGPLTVFEGATCLGEGLLTKTLSAGDHALVSYALETGVEIERRSRGEPLPVTRATLANGVLTTFRREALISAYLVRNKTAKPHVLHLDHSKAAGDYRLVEPREPAETLPAHYRFHAALEPKASLEILVREEREISTQISILSQNPEQLRAFLQQPWLSKEEREVLARITGLMEERAVSVRKVEQAEKERTVLAEDQERLRKNMEVMRDSPKERAVREQYLERLLKAEERLEALRAEIAEAALLRQDFERRIVEALEAFKS